MYVLIVFLTRVINKMVICFKKLYPSAFTEIDYVMGCRSYLAEDMFRIILIDNKILN